MSDFRGGEKGYLRLMQEARVLSVGGCLAIDCGETMGEGEGVGVCMSEVSGCRGGMWCGVVVGRERR